MRKGKKWIPGGVSWSLSVYTWDCISPNSFLSTSSFASHLPRKSSSVTYSNCCDFLPNVWTEHGMKLRNQIFFSPFLSVRDFFTTKQKSPIYQCQNCSLLLSNYYHFVIKWFPFLYEVNTPWTCGHLSVIQTTVI